MPHRSDGTRFIGHHFTYFTPADWQDVSVALKKKIPGIRFSSNPGFSSIDRKEAFSLVRRELPAWEPHMYPCPYDRAGITSITPEPQPLWRVDYRDVIEAAPDDRWTMAWIEPSGWAPFWKISVHDGKPYIANRPSLSFTVKHGSFINKKASTDTPRDARFDGTWVRLIDGAWQGSYLPFEDDLRLLLGQFRRIVIKHSTNTFSWVHYATHAVEERSPPGTMERVGFHALEWARAHPDHWIGGSSDRNYIKPADWESARS